MNCINCGTELADGAKFCRICGTQVQLPVILNNIENTNSDKNFDNNKSVNNSKNGAGANVVLTLFAVLFSFLLAMFLVVIINMLTLKNGLSDRNIYVAVKENGISNIDVSLFCDERSPYYLDEYVVDMFVYGDVISNTGLTKKEKIELVDSLLGRENFKDYVIEQIVDIRNYLLYDNDTVSFSKDDLTDRLYSDNEGVNAAFSAGISKSDIYLFKEQLKKYKKYIFLNYNYMIIITGSICVLSMILILAFMKWKISRASIAFGITFLISGLLCFAERLAGGSYLTNNYESFTPYLKGIFNGMLAISLISILVGIAIMIISITNLVIGKKSNSSS